MMKALLSLLVFCFLSHVVLCQQRPQLTQYMQNNYLMNPAVAGIEDYGDLRAGYRSQWLGIERAPTTFYASIHASFGKSDRNVSSLRLHQKGASARRSNNKNNRFYRKAHHGVGAIAQLDQAGLIRAATVNVSYAYHLPLSSRTSLAGGVSTGLTQLNLNRNLFLQIPDDPLLYGDMDNLLRLDLGLGLWLYSQDYFVGISGTQLLGGRKRRDASSKGPQALLEPHYYFTGGYRVPVSDNLILTPSIMIKASESGQTAVDVNVKALHFERFWVGVSYRHKDALAGMLGVYLNHLLDVSYSYDFAISELRTVNANSHELVVGFKFNNPNKLVCPKYMW